MQAIKHKDGIRRTIKMIQGIYIELNPEGIILDYESYLPMEINCSSGNLCGKYWSDVWPDMQAEKDGPQGLPKLMLENDNQRYLQRLHTKAGAEVFIKWVFKKKYDSNGAIRSVIGVGQDTSSHAPADETLLRHYSKLLERNRVLTCLYEMAQLVVDDSHTFEAVLQDIVNLIPKAFDCPEKMTAAIHLDGTTHQMQGFELSRNRYGKDIVIKEEVRGRIEVGRLAKAAAIECKETTCSDEENNLLDTAARKVAYIVERKEANERKQILEEQLRHADRLATIGQLAAGIAHELNNPLGDILGFAQLASNYPDLPEQIYHDLNKIVKSTLYSREVIKKILLFSRQNLPHEGKVNLNALIDDWIDFFESRCNQNDIKIALEMDRNLPSVTGDSSQLNQVFINLVVNAIHAMPEGGVLTIRTTIEPDGISMRVQDTGQGIEPEFKDKIFLPFFTTKEVNQGTGLGLSVVYGIVNEHGGTVTVDSQIGTGSTFEVKLPFKLRKEDQV